MLSPTGYAEPASTSKDTAENTQNITEEGTPTIKPSTGNPHFKPGTVIRTAVKRDADDQLAPAPDES